MAKFHFCAMKQNSDSSLTYLDGTCDSDGDFSNPNQYSDMKNYIGKLMNPPAESGKSIVILSLSRINQ